MSSQKGTLMEIFNSIDFHQIKDHPNILIAAHFWEEDRLNAAKLCYKFLRAIDDLIDDHKAENRFIAPGEKQMFTATVDQWLKMIITPGNSETFNKELLQVIRKFRIPKWPLELFARSMIYDINNDGFPTLGSFIDYSQGASVSPASIFVHLAGLVKKKGRFSDPVFNVREASTPCAMFSYFVHIIRDFQKDQLNNLNYFADDLIVKHGLSRHDLREIAHGSSVSSNFRALIQEYVNLADKYRLETNEIIKNICPLIEPRYRLSLEIIFDLYLMIFERIDIKNGNFTSEELNPTPEETKERVYKAVINFTGKL
jgi:phytoene/squalene synthetase